MHFLCDWTVEPTRGGKNAFQPLRETLWIGRSGWPGDLCGAIRQEAEFATVVPRTWGRATASERVVELVHRKRGCQCVKRNGGTDRAKSLPRGRRQKRRAVACGTIDSFRLEHGSDPSVRFRDGKLIQVKSDVK
jgi:hypothetical protein